MAGKDYLDGFAVGSSPNFYPFSVKHTRDTWRITAIF